MLRAVPGDRLVALDQDRDHLERLRRIARHVLDRAQLAELRVRAGGRMAERADALGHGVDRVPELGVLRHEHQVQRVEHRPGHVPVEVVGRQVQRVGVGEAGATGRRRSLRGLPR
jgi:hypothetical protein